MFSFVEGFRNNETATKVIKYIKQLAGNEHFRIVHVCGTHEDTISKHGIRSMLPKNVEVLMGPGCPVCTVPPNKIDYAITLAESGTTLTTFGDMMRVPASKGSLADAKARGYDVRVVYSISDSVKLAEKTGKDVVHFSVGFETTAPTTASEMLAEPPENFSVYSAHLLIPPALIHLLEAGETTVDGFINPGHVSTIIGEEGYRSVADKFKVPQVIAGFEPLDVLFSVAMILKQIREGRGEVENSYRRAVKSEGAPQALKMLKEVFEFTDAPWRGIGIIPSSGLSLRSKFQDHDASNRHELGDEEDYTMPMGCKCGEVLRTILYPWDCPLYNNVCTPETPIGPCMVSHEGSCYISARYGVVEI